MKEKWK